MESLELARSVYNEYQKSRDFKDSLNLFKNVELNQKFVNGDQGGIS